ncbi:unnamed protein product [Darwinula stevensoni]|uniref:Uncharacterized protein n=1 Tax=Darwinula stevensoni TaxID=69355 RepID=A0A7R8WZW7_9CRUS|nr:unnamed protein product [Darwinula stevensoni]CAG0878645.1 unnamed protein product [Darwinula stevensoni]
MEAILFGVAGSVIIGAVLYIVSTYFFKEKSYEEVLEEQRKILQEEHKQKTDVKKDKKQKKLRKAQEKREKAEPAHEIRPHVEFEPDPEILEGSPGVKADIIAEKLKSAKASPVKEKPKPILHLKPDAGSSKEEDEEEEPVFVRSRGNSFSIIKPLDDLELKLIQDGKGKKKQVKEEMLKTKPATKKVDDEGGEKAEDEEEEEEPTTVPVPPPPTPSVGTPSSTSSASPVPPPSPDITDSRKMVPVAEPSLVVQTVNIELQASAPTQQPKKKKQKSMSPDQGFESLEAGLRKADLTYQDIQSLIEILLNKQQSAVDVEWTKKGQRVETVAQLKRQLEEKEEELSNEQQLVRNTAEKMKEMRTELAAEKSKLGKMNEMLMKKQQEVKALHAELQKVKDQNAADTAGFQAKCQQMQERMRGTQHIADDVGKLRAAMEQLQKERNALQQALEQSQTQVSTIQQAQGDMQYQLRKLQHEKEKLREKNWKVMDALNAAEASLAQQKQFTRELEERLLREQEQVKTHLIKVFPQVKIDHHQEFSCWVETFEKKVQGLLNDRSESDALTKTESAMQSLQAQLTTQAEENAKLMKDIDHYKSIVVQTEASWSKLQESAEKQEQEWKKKVDDRDTRVRDLEASLKQLEDEREKLQHSLSSIHTAQEAADEVRDMDPESFQSLVHSFPALVHELQEKLKELQAKLEYEEEQKSNLQAQFSEINKSKSSLEEQLESANHHLTSVAQSKEKEGEEIEKLKSEIEFLRTENSTLKSGQLSELKSMETALQLEKSRFQEQCNIQARMLEDLNETRARLAEKETVCLHLEQDNVALKANKNEAYNQNQETIERLEGELKKLQEHSSSDRQELEKRDKEVLCLRNENLGLSQRAEASETSLQEEREKSQSLEKAISGHMQHAQDNESMLKQEQTKLQESEKLLIEQLERAEASENSIRQEREKLQELERQFQEQSAQARNNETLLHMEKEKLKELEAQLAKLSHEADSHKTMLEQEREKLRKLEECLQEEKQKAEQKESALQEERKRLQELESRLQSQTPLEDMEGLKLALESERTTLKEENARLLSSLEQADKQREIQAEEISRLKHAADEQGRMIEEVKKNAAELRSQLEARENALAEEQNKIAKLQEQLQQSEEKPQINGPVDPGTQSMPDGASSSTNTGHQLPSTSSSHSTLLSSPSPGPTPATSQSPSISHLPPGKKSKKKKREVLFSYVRQNLCAHLEKEWGSAELMEDLRLLWMQAEAEGKSVPDLKLEDKEHLKLFFISLVNEEMDSDRKTTSLKQLQGHMWRKGYQDGLLQAHVYADAADCMRKWKSMGIGIFIYSSGSEEAQKLLFHFSNHGDLLPLISDHFDTKIGGKKEAASYVKIAQEIGMQPNQILFLTDIIQGAQSI